MTPPAPTIAGARTRTVATNGVELAVTEAGEGFPVLLAHGFPELSYSWRHQLPALAASGYRAVAPDMRGYGRSSRPEAIEDYDIVHLTDDLLGLLDDLGEERAAVVGHDWGAMVAWSLAQRAPDRVAGVVGMSVPFVPRPPAPPVEIMRQVFADTFFYMLYFQEPGVADADLAADPARTMRGMLAGLSGAPAPDGSDVGAMLADDGRGFAARLPDPERLPDWIDAAELDHYVAEFTRTGFTGGLNWYRNLDRNWELTAPLADTRIEVPALFVAGSGDPVLAMSPPSAMAGWVTDLRGEVIVEGAGPWVQQEAPDAVNTALVTFLDGLRPG